MRDAERRFHASAHVSTGHGKNAPVRKTKAGQLKTKDLNGDGLFSSREAERTTCWNKELAHQGKVTKDRTPPTHVPSV